MQELAMAKKKKSGKKAKRLGNRPPGKGISPKIGTTSSPTSSSTLSGSKGTDRSSSMEAGTDSTQSSLDQGASSGGIKKEFEKILLSILRTPSCTMNQSGYQKACKKSGVCHADPSMWDEFETWSNGGFVPILTEMLRKKEDFTEAGFKAARSKVRPGDPLVVDWKTFEAWQRKRMRAILDEVPCTSMDFPDLCLKRGISIDIMSAWCEKGPHDPPPSLDVPPLAPKAFEETLNKACTTQVTNLQFSHSLQDVFGHQLALEIGAAAGHQYLLKPMPQYDYSDLGRVEGEDADWLAPHHSLSRLDDYPSMLSRAYFVLSPESDLNRDSFIGVQVGSLERRRVTKDDREWLNIPVVLKVDPKTLFSQGLYIINPNFIDPKEADNSRQKIPNECADALEDLGLKECFWGRFADKAGDLPDKIAITDRAKCVGSKRFVACPAFSFDSSIKSSKDSRQD